MLNTFSKILCLLFCFSIQVSAQLIPLNEADLSIMTGQAFINIDHNETTDLDFTKITLGLDVETSLNADLIELGNYADNNEQANSADVRIRDFGLGSIDKDGNIVPFKIKDPFVELAFDNSSGRQDLVGFRLGFGGAQGTLSGAIEFLSGNINVNVQGSAAPIRDANFLARILLSDSNILGAQAVLVRGPNEGGDVGNPITEDARRRASWVGIPEGDSLGCISGCTLGSAIAGVIGGLNINCGLVGIDTCFPLKNFQSLRIGDQENDVDANGLFLSFQTKAITWYDQGVGTPASKGAFFNIPNGGITVDFDEAFNGTPRVRTRYVDPYFD